MSIENQLSFTVTNDHIILLRNLSPEWMEGETGAPHISPSHPFGNENYNGEVAYDVAAILEIEPDAFGDLSSSDYMRCARIYRELEYAFAILLRNLSIEEGVYERESVYSKNWVKSI